MPADARRLLVREHVERATNHKGLRDSRADRNSRLLSPRQDRARRFALLGFGRSRIDLVLRALEDQLPLLDELPLVPREVADEQKVLSEPARALLEGAIESRIAAATRFFPASISLSWWTNW
jgi:hypothetical protein